MRGMAKHVQIEVCVDSVASAVAAQEGGADRVELCQNLFEGGTTPSVGTIQAVRDRVELGLYVIIRPRGGDFHYSHEELDVMVRDIAAARAAGADGIVLGLLRPNGRVDGKRTHALIQEARPLPVTFHRAFDMTRDPFEAMEDLIDLGCERVLTSGQEASVLEGVDLISELVRKAKRRIIIMPGGGIHERNFSKIVKATRAREFHLTGSTRIESRMTYRNSKCFMGKELRAPEFHWSVTEATRIQALREVISN